MGLQTVARGLATFYGIDSTPRLSYEALYWKQLNPQENNFRCQTDTNIETVSLEVFLFEREGAVTDEGLSWQSWARFIVDNFR